MLSAQELREKVLYPVVRVKAAGAGGSGVLIYSQPDPRRTSYFINLALTCEHVIDGAIKIKDDWNPVLKQNKKTDFLEEVAVEVFDYDESKVISANSTAASIVAYDKRHDLAMVRLHNPRQMPYIAPIIPESRIGHLNVFDPIWTSGCSLLHDPFANAGTLTYLREIIEQKTYLMANAPSIFGNSGGGLFDSETGELLGLTSRVSSIQVGFGVDIMTWMQFSTHPERLYEFLRDWEMGFLWDAKDDWYKAEERREKKRRESLRQLLVGSQALEAAPEKPVDEVEN